MFNETIGVMCIGPKKSIRRTRHRLDSFALKSSVAVILACCRIVDFLNFSRAVFNFAELGLAVDMSRRLCYNGLPYWRSTEVTGEYVMGFKSPDVDRDDHWIRETPFLEIMVEVVVLSFMAGFRKNRSTLLGREVVDTTRLPIRWLSEKRALLSGTSACRGSEVMISSPFVRLGEAAASNQSSHAFND